MELSYNTRYPSVDDLRKKAQKRIPKFAFEYLVGGCNDDVNLLKNTAEIRQLELIPRYLSGKNDKNKPSLQTTLFGHTYDAPFGIAPVGLQGLMWPKATEILAKATFGYRPRDIRNGLEIPPRMTLENILEIALHPRWALNTLINWQLEFANTKRVRHEATWFIYE